MLNIAQILQTATHIQYGDYVFLHLKGRLQIVTKTGVKFIPNPLIFLP